MELFDLRLWHGFEKAIQNYDSIPLIDQIAIDSRRISSRQSLFVALEGEREDGHRFVPHAANKGARFALVKKHYCPPQELENIILLKVEDPLKAFQEIASCYRQKLNIPILAIAGTYGKTMTKDLLQQMLRKSINIYASPESFNSQIGVPLSIVNMNKNSVLALIETGISKEGEMQSLAEILNPQYAVITSIKESHISTLKNLNNILKQKIKLIEKIPEHGWILAPSEMGIETDFQNLKLRKHFWNQNCPSMPHASLIFQNDDELGYQVNFPDKECFKKVIPHGLPFMVDLINICLKTSWLFNISKQDILESLLEYVPELMHTEVWTSPQGATFINDTYTADPISVGKALKNLPQTVSGARRIFFFDGLKNKMVINEQDFCHIGDEIVKANINHLILAGSTDFTHLIKHITEKAPQTEISLFANRHEAFSKLKLSIKRDDLILIKGSRKENLENLSKDWNDIVKDNRLIINLAAIRSNIEMMRTKLTQKTRIMAMVKAFAYGTDQIILGKFLHRCGIDILGVAHVDEGIVLRTNGVQQSIFVINAAIYEIAKLVSNNFEVGVSDPFFVKVLAEEALKNGKKIKVHLHVDTGMSRLGCRPEEALDIAKLILSYPQLELEGLMTHFSSAENSDEDSFTFRQIHQFNNTIGQLKSYGIHPKWIHAANSSGSLRFDLPNCNMVRAGLALYGLQSSTATKNALKLRLAISLKTKIAGINVCKSGDSISYGRTYLVKSEEERIGVIPLGYFDGIHRHYSGKSSVIVRGKKAPMVGNICMDFMMINITEIPDAKIGDTVLFFGEDEFGNYLSPEEFAAKGNTNAHELITCLGPRIQRLFIDDEK